MRQRALPILLTAGLAFAVGFGAILLVRAHFQTADCRNLGDAHRFQVNSVSFIPCLRAYLVHGTGQDFALYLAESPHLPGEPLRYDQTRHRFFGLHGETFDLRGHLLKGPAAGPLIACPLRIEDGALLIEAPSPEPAEIRAACKSGRPPGTLVGSGP